MKRMLTILLLLCCLLLCLPAGAESLYSEQNPTYTRLAALDGVVYCLEGPSMIFGPNALLRVSPSERTAVRGNIHGWECLYAAGDQLLMVETVMNLGEMLGSVPASAMEAQLYDPATGRDAYLERSTYRAETGVIRVFGATGSIYRLCREGDSWELQRLADLDDRRSWQTVAGWTGSRPDIRSTFCVIGDGKSTILYEYAAGVGHDVTALMRQGLIRQWTGVLEDGVLYQVQDGLLSDWLTALDLTTGEKTKILRLARDRLMGFLLDEQRAILLYSEQGENYRADVYDRSTWTLTAGVPFSEYPNDALLVGDLLYVANPYQEAGLEIVNLVTGESIRYRLK